MQKELLAEIKSTSTGISQTLSSFTEQQMNAIPFEGSWTPAQVADHINKSLGLIIALLYGTTQKGEKNPAGKIEAIRKMFQNFEHKMNAAEALKPATSPIQKTISIATTQDNFAKLTAAVNTLELPVTCMDFELPVFHHLTRLEWAYFALYHSQRHLQQLKNILTEINKAMANPGKKPVA